MKIRMFLGAVVLLILGGCLKKSRVNFKNIHHISRNDKYDTRQTKDGVTLTVKKFEAKDSEEILGANLLKGNDPIVPIQISVENRSGHIWYLQKGCVDLNFADKKTVENRLTNTSFARGGAILLIGTVAVGALTAVAVPLFVAAASPGIFGFFVSPLVLAPAIALVAISAAGIPYTIYKAVSTEKSVAKVNEEIKDFIKSTGIPKNSLVIADDCDADLIVFVYQKDLKDNFNLKLLRENESLDFNLAL